MFYVEKSPEFEVEEFFVAVGTFLLGLLIGAQLW